MNFPNQRRHLADAPRVLTVLAAGLALAATAVANINNSGFEFAAKTVGLPLQKGKWGFDLKSYVTVGNQGIIPASDNKMLSFDGTGFGGGGGTGCDVIQFVDLADWPAIGNGSCAHASVRVNRVDMPGVVDTAFYIQLYAFDSLADAKNLTAPLATAFEYFISDSDTLTWETVSVEMGLPPGTLFVGVAIGCAENVVDDISFPEFKGNYADDVCLNIVTYPAGP